MLNSKFYLGIDIGGTKCAIVISNSEFYIIDKTKFDTDVSRGYKAIIEDIISSAEILITRNNLKSTDIISCGISCGGPLDNKRGIIMSPPNLPDWDNVPITDFIYKALGVTCKLMNDADACAIAEWSFGAGTGTENMIFLTFGTGMGAGLILNGKIYSGASGTAGEVGHIRLSDDGPEGYGKNGSFEGFCSGGGISNLAEMMYKNSNFKTSLSEDKLTAKDIAEAAFNGDKLAISIYNKVGEMLGRGLSILIDIFNPEMIVIGSIFERSGELMIESMNRIIRQESLPNSASICKIVPAMLGDNIGDYAAIGIAKLYAEEIYGK